MKIDTGGAFKIVFLFALGFLLGDLAQATPNLMTFQSRIVKPDGKALEAASVSFRFSITDALGTCVIYQEDFANRNMSGTKGLINLNLGGGTKVYPLSAMDLSEVFNNYNFPTFNCQSGGTVNAGATDRRRMVMQFNDGSGWQTLPAMDINSNPYALQASKANSLGDYPAADYLRIATLPTCNPATHALTFNGASFTCIAAGGAGAGTVTNVTSANADIAVATGTSTPVLTLNTGTGANQIVKLNGTAQLPAVDGSLLTGFTAAQIPNIDAAKITAGTIADARMPALTGDVTMTSGTTTTAISGLARSKLASGTNSHVVINDGSGVMSSEAQLAVVRGGTGTSSFTANQLVGVNGAGNGLISFTCGDGQVIKFNALGAAVCGTDAAGTGDVVNGGNTGPVVVGTNNATSLTLETNNAPAVTILSDGNVGIGTSSPTARLSLQAASNTTIFSGQFGSGNTMFYGQNYTGSDYEFRFYNNGGSQKMGWHSYPLQGPKLWLNSDDASKLDGSTDLYGATIGINIPYSVGAENGIYFGNANSYSNNPGAAVSAYTAAVGSYSNMGLKFKTGTSIASTKMVIDPSGNVGIGTNNPQRTLHTAGPIRITPTAVPAAPAAGDIYVDSADSNKLKFYDGSSWVAAGSGGGGGVTTVSSANNYLTVVNGSSTPTLTVNVGTAVDTVAAGNDSRITGAAQKSANLSDLADAATARSNLSLGTASTLNVGTGNNNVVQLDGSARLPAVDGSLLTGVVASSIADNAITNAKLADNAVNTAEIADLAVTNVKLAGSIDRSKLATGTNNHVIINDGSGVLSSEAQLAVARGGTGTNTFSANQLVGVNGTGSGLISFTCGDGQVIKFNALGAAVCGTDNGGAGDIVNGGNTGAVTIGTNDATSLTLETNNAPALTILSGGNVGVGTATPAAKVHAIVSSEGADGLNVSSATGSIILRPDGTNGNVIRFGGSGGSADTLKFLGPSDGEYFRVDGSLMAIQPPVNIVGGSLRLIGSTGISRSGSSLDINNTSSTNSDVRIFTSSALSGVERVRIDSTGNVGIGTTNPQRLLHLAGPMRITPTTVPAAPAAGDMYVDSADSNKLKIYDGSGWVAAGGSTGGVTEVSSANADIGVATGTTTPVLTLNVGTGNNQIVKLNGSAQLPAVSGANLTALNASQLGSGTVPDARMPALTGDVTTAAGAVATTIAVDAVTSAKILNDEIVNADINSSAAIARSKLASGTNNHVLINSGAGVMTSEAQLAVSRGGTGTNSFAADQLVGVNGTGSGLISFTCGDGQVIKFNALGAAVCGTDNGSSGDIVNGGNTGAVTIGTNNATSLTLETNNAPALTVLSGGNVGIGTTSPITALQVLSSDKGFSFSPGTSTTDLYMSTNYGTYVMDHGWTGGNGLSFGPNGFSNPTVWMGSGRMGINYYNQASALDIRKTASDNYLSLTNASLGDIMVVNSSGNVGIGTTSPSTTFHVVNPVGTNQYSTFQSSCAGCASTGVRIYNSDANDGSAANLHFDLNANGPSQSTYARIAGLRTANTAGALKFETSTAGALTEKMRIDHLGNVAIGTTSVSTKLKVLGNDGGVFDLFTATGDYDSFYMKSVDKNAGFSGDAEFFMNPEEGIHLLQGGSNLAIGAGGVSVGLPASQNFEVQGGNVIAPAYLYSSDQRLKTNVQKLDGMELALKLVGVHFNWLKSGEKDIGFLAQQVEQIVPELVHTDSRGWKSVKYGNIVAILVEAFKTQNEIVMKQESQISRLNIELADSKNKIENQENRLKTLEAQMTQLLNQKDSAKRVPAGAKKK